MTHRTDRVWLDPAEARCEPLHQSCADKGGCARYLAEIPQGGKMADYTIQRSPFVPFCAYFRRPKPRVIEEQPREVKPWPREEFNP